ncbi:MAG: nucleotidyltransferase substrate binding protein [Francisellaceae bacterium]
MTLAKAYDLLIQSQYDSLDYELYRSAVIKEFEIILEQAGKLTKKALTPYFHSKKAVDRLPFKDIFRHAAQHGLLSLEQVERWLIYRENRNSTSHDYGFDLAENTLPLIPLFIEDVNSLITMIEEENEASR